MNPIRILVFLTASALASHAAELKISPNSTTRAASEVEANYTTTHLYIDEVAADSIPVTIFFDPATTGVETAEVFTNLNRRDRAELDANSDGIEDGILPPEGSLITAGDDSHYFKAHTMSPGADGYYLTLDASKTGAYRLTARYKLTGDPTWHWYNNTDGGGKRDHCLVVSPADARDIRLYEMNVFNVEASGDTFAQRSTLEDLHNATGAAHNTNNRWDLDYLLGLGSNWLWFQPIHPNGIEGREPADGWGGSANPYDPGSPYAVKNFFEVSELMTINYDGSHTTQQNRAASMAAFQDFVAAADAKGVGVMLDAPFNHTAYDCELSQYGIDIFAPAGNPDNWQPTDIIKDREARFYSADGNYGQRATSASNVAAAPDRSDFGKWYDVIDVFFGRYDALVEYDDDGAEESSYTNEGDWLDTTTATGNFDQITQGVWRYFAQYTLHWLEQTGVPAGSDLATQTAYGIDGLRADFGQGLPPQCWEYLINKTRARKWNFVFMSESLDGGNVTYRSARHFDILNENIVFPLQSAGDTWAYRSIFEDRRTAYGQGLVLLNNTSHDETNYTDPWLANIRYQVCATVDGLPMIFPGQELGLADSSSHPTIPNFGYDHYEENFGKYIPHFKRWNSMSALWNDTDFGNDQLYPVYQGVGHARANSPALRSSNRWFIDGDGSNGQIFAVAKYQTANASPAFSDVVLAFANLDRNNDQSDNFKIPSGLAPLLGIQDSRTYNVKNLAAYQTSTVTGRRDTWLWGSGITGADLKSTGFTVFTKKVPVTVEAWDTAPFEAQYLKLYDVTPPPVTATPTTPMAYAIGTEAVFTWSSNAGPDDHIADYLITIGTSPGGNDIANAQSTAGQTTYTATAAPGQTLYATVTPVSAAAISGTASAESTGTILLTPDGDHDGDTMTNAAEASAGTDPLDPASVLRITSIARSGSTVTLTWPSTDGTPYMVQTSESLDPASWQDIPGSARTGDGSDLTHDHTTTAPTRFYRIRTAR
ncbi:MAG: hypothetical protein ACQCXQ_11520 [Verrucomicrobiales bacterium]|nr:hypothetical protein [Verrucomicrobiota bacterium JB025]